MLDQSWWDPATDGIPLTQGGRILNPDAARKPIFGGMKLGWNKARTQRKMGRKGIASTADHRARAMPDEPSARAKVERFYVGAARQLLDPAHDLGAMVEELVANDRVRREHDELVALDPCWMGVGRVRRADKFDPMIADRLLGRAAADLVFLKEFFDQRGQFARGALSGALRIIERNPAQIADEFLGELAELVRLIGHGDD
jgi:hypothetical protein